MTPGLLVTITTHNCHCLHMLNYQVLATHNHNVALHALFIRNSFVFLAVLISILQQLPVMNSLPFIVHLLVLLTMLHAGLNKLTSAGHLLDICSTMQIPSSILSIIYLLDLLTTLFVNQSSMASAPLVSLNSFPLSSQLLNV